MKFNLSRLKHILPIFKKKKTRRKSTRKKLRNTRKTKSEIFDKRKFSLQESEGYYDGKLLTGIWNLQSNPGKVHVGGYRIHHGLFGAALTFYGEYDGDDYIKGLGKSLMEDDINDISHWLDFEQRYDDFTGFA